MTSSVGLFYPIHTPVRSLSREESLPGSSQQSGAKTQPFGDTVSAIKLAVFLFIAILSACAASGQVFITGWASGGVSEYGLGGNFVNFFQSPAYVRAIATDGQGHLFVANALTGKVGEYTDSGQTVNSSLISGLQFPLGLSFDGMGHLFVLDAGAVKEFTTSGEPIDMALISGYQSPGGMVVVVPEPSGMCFLLILGSFPLFGLNPRRLDQASLAHG